MTDQTPEHRIYTVEEGDAKPDTPTPINPVDLGYPPDYNPYAAQAKRIKTAIRELDKAGEKLKEMGACYQQFGDEARSDLCGVLFATLGELRNCFCEFYVEKM